MLVYICKIIGESRTQEENMKKLFALLIVAAMVIALVPVLAVSVSADSAIEIGTAAELKDFIAKINDGTYADDTSAKLTADINLDISSVNYENWSPITILDYKGTIDGNGHTISGLSFTRYLENGGVQADPEKYNDLGGGADNLFCFGQISFAAFIYNFSGTLKNINFDSIDISLLIHNTNRNYRSDVAAIVGRALDGATFENISLSNITVAANDRVNSNQGHIGGAAALIGRAQNGTVTIKNCSIEDSSVNMADTSTVTMPSGTSCTMINGRLEVGAFVGYVENADVNIYDSTYQATLAELASDAVWNIPGNKFYEGQDGQQAGPINTNRVDGEAGDYYGYEDEASAVTVILTVTSNPDPDPVPTGDVAAIAIAAVAVLSLAGAAVVANKRKF